MLSVSNKDLVNPGYNVLRYATDLKSKRTIIVTGLGRSGTTAMIGSLFRAGLPQLSDYLAPRTLDDWKLGTYLDDKDKGGLRREIVRRDDLEPVWGFKWHMVQNWYQYLGMFTNPHLVVMFRDSLTIALRGSQIREGQLESDPLDVWLKRVTLWNLQLSHSVINEVKCPTILVSYEKMIQSPKEVLGSVLDFCGYSCTEEVVEFIKPTKNSYTTTESYNQNPWVK